MILSSFLLPPSRVVRSIRVSGCSLRTFDHALCNVNHRHGLLFPVESLFRTIRAFPRTLHAAEWSSCFFSLRRLFGRLVQKRIRRKFTFSVNSKQPGGAARSRQEENTRTRRDDDAAGCLFYSASILRALHGHAKRFGFRIANGDGGEGEGKLTERRAGAISGHDFSPLALNRYVRALRIGNQERPHLVLCTDASEINRGAKCDSRFPLEQAASSHAAWQRDKRDISLMSNRLSLEFSSSRISAEHFSGRIIRR